MESRPHVIDTTNVGEAFGVLNETSIAEDLLVVLLRISLFIFWVLRDAEDGLLNELVLGLPDVAQPGVQDDRGNEAEKPIEGVQILGALRDMCSCWVDRIGKTRQERPDSSNEGDKGTGVDTDDIVAITSARIVQGRDVDVKAFDQPI